MVEIRTASLLRMFVGWKASGEDLVCGDSVYLLTKEERCPRARTSRTQSEDDGVRGADEGMDT
jgi:hypothetical protein